MDMRRTEQFELLRLVLMAVVAAFQAYLSYKRSKQGLRRRQEHSRKSWRVLTGGSAASRPGKES